MIWVRDLQAGDIPALADIFYAAVREGTAPAYTQAERQAWAAERPSDTSWAKRLDGLLTVVAEQAGEVVGFMSARAADGYLDLAFVAPQVRRTGVAPQLYAVLENRLRAQGPTRLHTRASHMAKPFFERAGWRVVAPNSVRRGGQILHNWQMEKTMKAPVM